MQVQLMRTFFDAFCRYSILASRIIPILIFSIPSFAAEDNSMPFFHQLATFRFGNELQQEVQANQIDLRDVSDDEFVHVVGKVKFIPGQWIEPRYYSKEEFEALNASAENIDLDLNLRTYPQFLEENQANFGSVILKFKIKDPLELTLNFPRFFHSMHVFYTSKDLQNKIYHVGELDQVPNNNELMNPFITNIPLISADSDFYLVIHLSAPLIDNKPSVNLSSFYIGENRYLLRLLYHNRFFGKSILGGFLIIFLFYTFIYTFRLSDLTSLYLSLYALFCFGMSTFYEVEYTFTPDEVIHYFTVLNIFAITFLQAYLLEKLRPIFNSKKIVYLIFAALCIAAVVAVLTLIGQHLLVGLLLLLSAVSSLVLILTTLVVGIRHRIDGVVFFTLGTLTNLTFQIPMLRGFLEGGNTENGYYILLANFGMIIGLALVNAKEFASTYRRSLEQSVALEEKNKEITFFNKNLEKLVDLKTREIRSLLDHIPQGVLSIGADGILSKDYSAHLEQVIDCKNIAGESFKSLILDRSSLSGDEKDQAWQTILVSIGQDELNFEVNVDKFPAEIPLILDNGDERTLKATWNVVVEEDEVSQILVTLLDITLEKALEKETEKQRKELELLQELLNIPANKASQFFLTSLPLLEEIERLIKGHQDDMSEAVIRTLFVNAHTVKGAARTLGLKELSTVIHDMESYYSQILKDGEAIVPNRMLADIEASIACLDKYKTMNKTKLNRSDDYSKIPVERSFIEKHYYLLNDLLKNKKIEAQDMIQALSEQSDVLTTIIFEQLDHVFDSYREKATKIAKDLGKEAPNYEFNVERLSISSDLRTTLDNCMIHLLRNSLDHGIEPAEERKSKNKSPAGTIFVDGKSIDNFIHIHLKDDGRGLALQVLRNKGLEQGSLTESSTAQDIANLIFGSGVSTADEVSMYSGRGVGMDAVRSFLEKRGGSVSIVLDEKDIDTATTQRVAFHFEIILPLVEDNKLSREAS